MSNYVMRYANKIPEERRVDIGRRYHVVTKSINNSFWNQDSDKSHSIYVGSYGRGTAVIDSDVDILVELPKSQYDRFNQNSGNSQSQLLQVVRKAIKAHYPTSDIRADGQIVKIRFSDGMYFEILPAFPKVNYWGNLESGFDYPDSNTGGKWRVTDPKIEQKAVKEKNRTSNGLFNATCQQIRAIHNKYYSSYKLPGIVIDSFIYSIIGEWQFVKNQNESNPNIGEFERKLLQDFNIKCLFGTLDLQSPGSNQPVDGTEYISCLRKVLENMVGE